MTETTEVQHQATSDGGRYISIIDGYEAEMTYKRSEDGTMIIDHTQVPEALGGRGIGKTMVKRAVYDARKANKKIVANCPYAKAQIEKNEDWRDVLK